MIAPALVAGAVACAGTGSAGTEGKLPARTIDEVLAAHTGSLMALPGVTGTAIGLCGRDPCIKVFLADSSPETRRRIPARLEGYEVSVEISGPIRAR